MARPRKTISEFDRKLGAAIKNRRTDPEFGMSQARLAKVTGIPLSNLQRREEGANEVTVSELERIAVALSTTPLAIVEDALNRYGGLEKLVAEYASTSAEPDNVAAGDNVTYLGHVRPPQDAAADESPRTPPKE